MFKRRALVTKGTLVVAALLALAPGASRADQVQVHTDRVASQVAPSHVGARILPQARIVGGTVIPATSAPYQVYLEGPAPGGRYSCGGSLLSPTVVLTAAHCVPGGLIDGKAHAASGMTILAGANAITPAGAVNVATYRIHPFYDAVGPTATTGDIAILTLASAINPNGTTIGTIGLPTPWTPTTAASPVPLALRVTGFGITANKGNTDGLLRAVDMTAQPDPDNCDDSPENAILLCAKSTIGSSCQGDSGGPLVTAGANPIQVGVVSNGGDCGPNTSDNYVNLFAPENRLWIDAALASTNDFVPPKAPRWVSDPSFSTSIPLKVGGNASCTAGAVTGSPTEQKVEFLKEDGTVLQSTPGTTAKMTIPAAAGGQRLFCRSYAANAGGTYLSPGLITSTAVPAAPAPVVTPTPAPGPVAGACGKMDDLKTSTLGVAVTGKPTSVRRGKKFFVNVRFSGLPATPFALDTETYPVKNRSKGYLETFDTFGAGSTVLRGSVRLKAPSNAKVGSRQAFRIVIWQANTTDELRAFQACAAGYSTVKVRIRR